MEALIARQAAILSEIKRVHTNFLKDSAKRKNNEYVRVRLSALDSLWAECKQNDEQLTELGDKSHQYFTEGIIQVIQEWYEGTRSEIVSWEMKLHASPAPAQPEGTTSAGTDSSKKLTIEFDSTHFERPKVIDALTELQQLQNANFRALKRLVSSIKLENLTEKWEIEDKLKNLDSRWNAIDRLHLQIDGILEGKDCSYYDDFSALENKFECIKRELNLKLNTSIYQQQAMPKIDIPTFSGNYTQWPTFMDLYSEAIHKNTALTKTQKMQHLKGRLRGEAERLVQHLHVAPENYDTCWELLNHRYNNKYLLFTKNFQAFMRQPNLQKQTAFELKRLYDVSSETIHAIHNLGINTSTWDPILVYILCEKLDSETYTEYMQHRTDPRDIPSYDNFMDFIESKFLALEPIQKRKVENIPNRLPKIQFNKTSFPSAKNNKMPYQQPTKSSFNSSRNFHTANVSQINKIICPLCNCDHALYQCAKFTDMTGIEKLKIITKFNISKNCLFVHSKGYCASQKRCKECNDKHNTLLHNAIIESSPMPSTSKPLQPLHANTYQKQGQNFFASNNDDEILLATALIDVRNSNGEFITLRALLDQGSQITLITENAAQRLGLKRMQFNANINGIGTLSNKSKGKIDLVCKSIYNQFQFTTEALIMPRVVSNLPNSTFVKKQWSHVTNISLADPDYNISRPIDILLDAHIYSEILMSGLIKGEGSQPIAQQTQLGWILSGSVKTYRCHVVLNNIQDIAQYWEIEDIHSQTDSTLTSQEQYCEDLFTSTTKRLESGRYEVRLPMKKNFEQHLGKSKSQAIAQFLQLQRKLAKNKELSENYTQFMQEYREMGHMKESKEDHTPFCYLPHHGVLKQDSQTTKLRVVFNASQKTDSGYSLNDLMECGSKLQQDLLTLLIGWRRYRYVFTADCEKMYRMILVNKDDQQLQKIIWMDAEGRLQEYKLCTVTYGTKAAPFLALRTLKQLAIDDAHKYPLASDVIRNEMYVDDVLSGSNSLQQTRQIQQQLIHMLQGAGLTLRKWASNESSLIENLASSELSQTTMHFKREGNTKALGLQWNPIDDTFTFTCKIDTTSTDKMTKRKLLSDISKIFDPLGWITPLTVKAKLLFQKVWLSKCSWDDILSTDIQDEWRHFTSDIPNLTKFNIPRWLGDMTKKMQIHGFCDASEKVYACAIYIMTLNDKDEPIIRLITAKSRLAPISKKLTLPRLELCGAVLLARLMKKVLQAFQWEKFDTHTYAWTDSMIVLSWLHGDTANWKTFVSNRVHQVHDVIPKQHWNYVKSKDNPADCATRGNSCLQLLQNQKWWQGPDWLKSYNEKAIPPLLIADTTCETKQSTVCVTQSEPSSLIIELIDTHSNMTHIIRVVAWIMRFMSKQKNRHVTKYLTSEELKKAELIILKQIQIYAFREELSKLKHDRSVSCKSNIFNLNPFIDNDNILRVGGRLNNSHLSMNMRNPILLPHDSKLTDLVILQAHHETLHGGPKLTLAHLRQKFWIVGGHRAVKRVLHRCVTCRRFAAKSRTQIMADLPEPRVTISRPFLHTGVDFTGHIEIKANKGRGIRTLLAYTAVFVCLATKAIHLELVTELSSAAFLAAFKRFCARRGKPSDMYSDNGTNFIGANRILLKQYRLNTIDVHLLGNIEQLGIKWHFNAPIWPSAGGLWEAAVKSMKYHLKRVLGEQRLTYEEFTTLLHQIEACLNSRPLCTLTESTEDIDCLTPGHFLTGTNILTIPESEDNNFDLRKRWQMVQKITNDFWKRWSREYLQQMQVRLKWKTHQTDARIDDIVCIQDEKLPAGKWALGRVTELHPGKDGHTRLVTLKTAKGDIKRPITKLVTLIDAPSNDKCEVKCRTRKGSSWKSLICSSLLVILMTFITPTIQMQTARDIKITTITGNQTIYFDKISDVQEIKDEWKLVFFYNMTNYWQNVAALEQYVIHLKQFQRDDWAIQFHVLINQLEQGINELNYYNNLLKTQHLMHNRYKRGLIDGIGYVANTLFGVLDQRFADKYESDIKNIQNNENHMLQLIKNQTSILETENNILQRNEATMIKHFYLINEQINALKTDSLKEKLFTENGFYVITSSIAAESMIQNLKYIQQTIINTLTNMYQGHIDIHLLSANQLQKELDKIARYLPRNLALPDVQNDVKELYKLFRIHARITKQNLLMEIKIPLLSDELYELSKLISIPQRVNSTHIINVIPVTEFIAFNINRHSFIPLHQSEIYECQKIHELKLLCKFNHPVYNLGSLTQSICNQQIIRNNEQHDMYCNIELKTCMDKWIQLHKQNTWFYYCCEKCYVHIICPGGMTSETLLDLGLITLGRGCVLRGDTFMLYANMEYSSQVSLKLDNVIQPPEISPINNIVNTSINSSFHIENHNKLYKHIEKEINLIKEQSGISNTSINNHDLHHYAMIYIVLFICIALSVTSVWCWRRIARKALNTSRRTEHMELQKISKKDEKPEAEDLYSTVQQNVKSCEKGGHSSNQVKFDTKKHSDVC